MKTTLFAFTALAVVLCSGSSFAATKFFKADMTPDSETTKPVGTTFGTTKGTAKFSYDDVTKRLCGQVAYQGLTSAVQAAHIHEGAIGVDGAAFVSFQVGTASPIDVDQAIDPADEPKLVADKMYVNVHTANNPGGEIRGELIDDPAGTNLCPGAGPTDAGADAAEPDGGYASSSSSSSSGSSGATTTRADSGTDGSSSTASSSCATSPGGSSSPLVLAMGAGAVIALAARKRRKR